MYLACFITQVTFPCRLEVNSGGGESLYRAAAQHVGLGQEAFKELRKYAFQTGLEIAFFLNFNLSDEAYTRYLTVAY